MDLVSTAGKVGREEEREGGRREGGRWGGREEGREMQPKVFHQEIISSCAIVQ